MKQSGMIQTSPDSRWSITQPLLSERTSIETSGQQKKQTNSDSTPQATPIQSQQTRKKPTKKTGPSAANSESNTTSKDIDLAQDSDKENA
jgi:hypothetical protein